MKSYNFNSDLAAHLVGQIENHFWAVASVTRNQIIAELGDDPSCENCECDSISYNNTDSVTAKLVDLVNAMQTATVAETYGNLVPQFLCISGKAIAFNTKKAKDGKDRSKPVAVESPKEDSSGS